MTPTDAQPNPSARASAQAVGWILTALTCFVLVVGVMIVRQATQDWRRVEYENSRSSAPIASSDATETPSAPESDPLVLKPAPADPSPWRTETARSPGNDTTVR